MQMLALIDCAALLRVTPRSLSIWVQQANMQLQDHPTDGRSKCLTLEQVQQLADLHKRNLRLDILFTLPLFAMKNLEEEPLLESAEEQIQTASVVELQEQVDLRKKLSRMEIEIAMLQEQVAQMAILLLYGPTQGNEQIQQLLKTLINALGEGSQIRKERSLHPAEQRARDREIPQILYDVKDDSYTIVCAGEGNLTLIPDTPEWFDWLASLSSFHFVGKNGRYTASRIQIKSNEFSRSWKAQRTFKKKPFHQHMGITERLTIHHLEAIAASIFAKITASEDK